MGERLIKPYEISVWEDRLAQDGVRFEEIKIAVIGSDTMTGVNKAYDPVFHKKSNGERTLTFSLKYKYFDPYIGNEEIVNPFAALLANERKVKLHYDGKWYEFIVKNHTESSEEYTWTYTCTDAFVLELSKNGYDITFDSELGNNQGTARELAKETIKDTDWQLGGANIGKQLIAEPIYKAVLESTTDIEIINASGTSEAPPAAESDIYVFYSYVKNQSGKNLQFIIRNSERQYTIDDNNVITDTNFRITTDLIYKNNQYVEIIPELNDNPQEKGWYEIDDEEYVLTEDTEVIDGKDYYKLFLHSFWLNDTLIISIGEVETSYQANRLAYNQLTTYDSVMGRTVDRFAAGDREIYKYTDYTYTTSNVVLNYITNGENFNALEDGTLQGWNPYTEQSGGANVNKLSLVTKPELGAGKELADLSTLSQIEGFLKYQPNGVKEVDIDGFIKNTVYNSGVENNASFIGSFSRGEKFVFRWRAGVGDIDNLGSFSTLGLIVAKYTQDAPGWGYYYKHINEDDVILKIEPTQSHQPIELNNYIRGGVLSNDHKSYEIDGVVQSPSTKYIYVVEENGVETKYIFNAEEGEFEVKTNSNYLPYYYLTGEVEQAIANVTLSDPTEKIGIFIYATEVETETTTDEETQETTTAIKPIYIQDIQLTRFVPDGADATGETPVIIGNVPTAISNPTEYYYLKPEDGTAAEDIQTYTSIEELKTDLGITDEVIPLYNEDSEKVLSISVSQSNCFNILQTIAETFECWIDLVVLHDNNGYIQFVDDIPQKFVYLKEYAGKDNWAGFKYGVNLQSIEREVSSDEIVTKLIVDQTQSDYTDTGYVSISNAPSNTSGESYILNFDYYYNQGLLDRDEVEKDRIAFSEDVAEINLQLQDLEKQRRDLEASLTSLGSKRNVYSELVTTAQDTATLALSEFESLTGWTYEDYKDAQTELILYDGQSYILTRDTEIVEGKTYYTRDPVTGVMTPVVTPDVAAISTYYEVFADLTEEETIVSIIGELYVSSATINNYSGILTNIEQEYWRVRKELRGSENYNVKVWVDIDDSDQRHVFVELNDYLDDFTFTIGSDTETASLSKKFFDIVTSATVIEFTAPTGYYFEGGGRDFTYTINDNKTAKFKIICDETVEGIEDFIDNLLEQKKEYTKTFFNKYSRFIQEGTWSSTDYIDSELYYLDALQVSNTSAQPTVSYTINVVEISELEGFEWYLFDAGDKSYVEDTEFFGWANVNGVLTPAREEVIVSEVEWHLDDPSQNVITVQNYKTRFEDLFQRISATIQTVQYNEATYAKISTLLDADGTINQDVLLASMNRMAGEEYALTTDGSIQIHGDEIIIHNLTNAANYVMINNEGIKISSDGGDSWSTAIDGQGINIGTVYTGSLNTNQVIIGSDENPSFRWDKSGISAYKSKQDDTYDLQTYVRYDEYGLYGIKEGGTFKANSLQDVLDKAHFAVTWDGFFIKNSYEDGGRVSITSNNDFQVIDGNNQERIKIGSWVENGTRRYGIKIKNAQGTDTFYTDDVTGDVNVTGTINATGGNFTGTVNVGAANQDHIIIDGANSLIKTSTYQDGAGNGWLLTKEGDAYFNNITARGAIKTAVFEYAEIQAVGGLFIFRPSSTIRTAEVSGNNLVLTVEKPVLFKNGQWCKVSNYASGSNTSGGEAVDPDVSNILLTNGLTHVYEVQRTSGSNDITLLGAAAMVSGQSAVVESAEELVGGALVDMGNKEHGSGRVGTSNYGIGVNSSDNSVNLPARAISLFETVIDETHEPKVTYNYRGILGTLPIMSSGVDTSVYQNMQGTQGIYTDNMYIGDGTQFLAFYEDGNGDKQLRIKANQIIYEVIDPETHQPTGDWNDINDAAGQPGPPGQDAITVRIDSNVGDEFVMTNEQARLTCTVYQGNTDITNTVTRFTWTKLTKDGTPDTTWNQAHASYNNSYVDITTSEVNVKAIFNCHVTIPES